MAQCLFGFLVGDSLGGSFPHCCLLVGSCGADSFHHRSVSGHQLLQKQEAHEATLVQQCLQQHPMVHLCQGTACCYLLMLAMFAVLLQAPILSTS